MGSDGGGGGGEGQMFSPQKKGKESGTKLLQIANLYVQLPLKHSFSRTQDRDITVTEPEAAPVQSLSETISDFPRPSPKTTV